MSTANVRNDINADIKSGAKLLLPVEVTKLKWLPTRRAGKKLHISTVHRWFSSGGLECVRAGATLCTTEAALLRYFNKRATPSHEAEVIDHSQGHADAERELTACGI